MIAAPRSVPWRSLASDGLQVFDWDVSPDAARVLLLVSKERGETQATHWRVVDLATASVVMERPCAYSSVFWIGESDFVGATRRPGFTLEVCRARTGEIVTHWTHPHEDVRGRLAARRRHGGLSIWHVQAAGPRAGQVGLWMIDVVRGALVPWRVTLPALHRTPGYGAQRNTRVDVGGVSGAILVVDDPGTTGRLVVSYVDPDTRVLVHHAELAAAPGRRRVSTRLVGENHVLARDGHYEGTTPYETLTLFDAVTGAKIARESAPSFGYGARSDGYRALDALDDAISITGASALYGVSSRGEGRERDGWVVAPESVANAALGAPWPARIASLAWLDAGPLVTLERPFDVLYRRAAPDDVSWTEIAIPNSGSLTPRVHVSPRERWVFVALASERGRLSYVDADALRAA